MKDILNHLFQHKTLSKDQAREVLKNITEAKYNDYQISSFLTVFAMRPITVDELSGFMTTLQELCIRVDLGGMDSIDMCGTGGDGKNTFNISTLASFVVAGAGYKVTKHGNYAVSSGCGSSNVIEAMGHTFSPDSDKLKAELERSNICYMHAPLFHPAMKHVGPIRKGLGVKTFFNMLGPLINPAFPLRQVVGVFNLELARLYKYVLSETGKKFITFYNLDGYDEISLTDSYKMISDITEEIVSPAQMGLETYAHEELSGGSTVEDATKIFKNVLNCTATKAQSEVVIANAALGIHCFKPEVSIVDCVAEARESLESKKALNAFKKFLH